MTEYRSDLDFLHKLRNVVVNDIAAIKDGKFDHVKDPVHLGFYRQADNGWEYRTVYPNGLDKLIECFGGTKNTIYCVGFIGDKKPDLSDSVRDLAWSLDDKLIAEMSRHEHMVTYLTGQREAGADWGNLVLFVSEDAVPAWSGTDVHRIAVNDISPNYYCTVRIHSGRLKNGITDEHFVVDKTIFLDYTGADVERSVKYW